MGLNSMDYPVRDYANRNYNTMDYSVIDYAIIDYSVIDYVYIGYLVMDINIGALITLKDTWFFRRLVENDHFMS